MANLDKIYADAAFADAVVPTGKLLRYLGYDTGAVGGNVVMRYKDHDGNFGTLSAGGGAGGEYYKCASVDTATQTWTGYKAVLADGVYAFETTTTTGLTYTSVTPMVGLIYTADALIAIRGVWMGDPLLPATVPATGLVAYYPFVNNLHDIVGDYDATSTADMTYDIGGVSNLSESNVITLPTSLNAQLSDGFTIACMIYHKNYTYGKISTPWKIPDATSAGDLYCQFHHYSGYGWLKVLNGDTELINFRTNGSGGVDYSYPSTHMVTVTYDGTQLKAYFDDVQTESASFTGLQTPSGGIIIGSVDQADMICLGPLAIYNRAITATEVINLRNGM